MGGFATERLQCAYSTKKLTKPAEVAMGGFAFERLKYDPNQDRCTREEVAMSGFATERLKLILVDPLQASAARWQVRGSRLSD
jgi:hypothetical protein